MASTNPFLVSGKTGNTAISIPDPVIPSAHFKDSGTSGGKVAFSENFRDPLGITNLTNFSLNFKTLSIDNFPDL
jgi:hypothetical protein